MFGYVKTEDGYLLKKDKAVAKIVNGKTVWYRPENAPKWDKIRLSENLIVEKFYRQDLRCDRYGTPYGYISEQDHQKIITELKKEHGIKDNDKDKFYHLGPGDLIKVNIEEPKKNKKRKNGQRRTKTNPRAAGRPKKK